MGWSQAWVRVQAWVKFNAWVRVRAWVRVQAWVTVQAWIRAQEWVRVQTCVRVKACVRVLSGLIIGTAAPRAARSALGPPSATRRRSRRPGRAKNRADHGAPCRPCSVHIAFTKKELGDSAIPRSNRGSGNSSRRPPRGANKKSRLVVSLVYLPFFWPRQPGT